MPNVFSIVVTYNGLQWLKKCIGSLLGSTISLKLIVVDNFSTDGTLEYIRKHFPEVELIENKKNLGFGQANNIGIRKAYDVGADYVFLLNQDAWVEKDTIEKLVEVAEKNPEFGIVSPMHLNGRGDALDFRFSKWVGPDFCPGFYSDLYFQRLKEKVYETSYVNAAAWLISRKCIETVGGFNPLFFVYGEDDNYLQRTHYHKLQVGVYPFAKILHDREEKELHEAFVVHEKKLKRSLLRKYCDPACQADIGQELHWLKRGIIKSIVKLNLGAYYAQKKDLKTITELQKDVRETKEKSKKPGLTFL
jgi:GT2 family glycosyltransferase